MTRPFSTSHLNSRSHSEPGYADGNTRQDYPSSGSRLIARESQQCLHTVKIPNTQRRTDFLLLVLFLRQHRAEYKLRCTAGTKRQGVRKEHKQYPTRSLHLASPRLISSLCSGPGIRPSHQSSPQHRAAQGRSGTKKNGRPLKKKWAKLYSTSHFASTLFLLPCAACSNCVSWVQCASDRILP